MENASLVSSACLLLNQPKIKMVAQTRTHTTTGSPAGGIYLKHKLLCAGTAACIADLLTFPLDTAKVRLQVMIISLLLYFK